MPRRRLARKESGNDVDEAPPLLDDKAQEDDRKEVDKKNTCVSPPYCAIKDNLIPLLIGICMRLFIFRYLSSDLQNRPEWSSPLVSVRRLRDGVAMKRDGVDPYSGDIFHVLPMYLFLFDKILDVENENHLLAFHVIVDCLTGILFSVAAYHYSIEKGLDAREVASKVAKFYFFNPLSAASCALLNLTTLHNFLFAMITYFFCKGCVLFSSLFLCFSIVSSLYPLTLIASLWLRFNTCKERCKMFAVLFTVIPSILALNYLLSGRNWEFTNDIYFFILRVDDLTPNCGIFWYFFTQVFEHFRDFYLAVFQANAFIYMIPLTLSLRNDAHLHLIVSLLLLSVFSAYPSLADSTPYFTLLPLLSKYTRYLRYTLVLACTCVTCLVLMPVMWHMWIVSGSGNANFYFGATLIYNVAQVYLMMDLLFAYIRYDGDAHYGEIVDENTKFVLH